MSATLASTSGGVTLIGGGTVARGDLERALSLAPLLVAADGGADLALSFGHVPQKAIGDFDSISQSARDALGPDRLIHISEQDSTDFGKALSRIEAGFVLAVGFAGLRLDHTLAALNVMIRHPAPPCVMLAGEDIAFLAPPRLSLPLAAGTRVSLFPMGPARGESLGLRWPVDGIAFAPDGAVGTSNEATGPVTLRSRGPLLVMLPRDCLDQAVAAITGPMSG